MHSGGPAVSVEQADTRELKGERVG